MDSFRQSSYFERINPVKSDNTTCKSTSCVCNLQYNTIGKKEQNSSRLQYKSTLLWGTPTQDTGNLSSHSWCCYSINGASLTFLFHQHAGLLLVQWSNGRCPDGPEGKRVVVQPSGSKTRWSKPRPWLHLLPLCSVVFGKWLDPLCASVFSSVKWEWW